MEFLAHIVVYGGLLLIGFIPAYAARSTYKLMKPDKPEKKPPQIDTLALIRSSLKDLSREQLEQTAEVLSELREVEPPVDYCELDEESRREIKGMLDKLSREDLDLLSDYIDRRLG